MSSGAGGRGKLAACFHVVLVTTGHPCSQGREAVGLKATDVPVFVGRIVRMPGNASSGDKCCKKKHRWGERPRDRKEAAHVEDRGRREVRAGRAGQRGGGEMRFCGGWAGLSGLYFVEEEIEGQSSSEAVPWGSI